MHNHRPAHVTTVPNPQTAIFASHTVIFCATLHYRLMAYGLSLEHPAHHPLKPDR